jgi:ferric iron reductase FhuF-like transporter
MFPLVPITATLATVFGTSTGLPGLAPDLVVRDTTGWQPAAALADGQFGVLLRSAERQWNARPPAAAALAWKAYTYWLTLPAVIGLLACHRVPLLRPADVWIRLDWPHHLLTVGLRAGITVAVLPADPLAAGGDRTITVVPDETALLATLRQSLIDEHLTPLIAAVCRTVRLQPRALLGSLAANIAATALRVLDGDAITQARRIEAVLSALGLTGLLELTAPDAHGQVRVRRKTCCLAFTLPRPRVCRDCCIRT